MKCELCNSKMNKKDNSMFIRQFISEDEYNKLPVKTICCSCKKELMFANLISII